MIPPPKPSGGNCSGSSTRKAGETEEIPTSFRNHLAAIPLFYYWRYNYHSEESKRNQTLRSTYVQFNPYECFVQNRISAIRFATLFIGSYTTFSRKEYVLEKNIHPEQKKNQIHEKGIFQENQRQRLMMGAMTWIESLNPN